jgi:hypothetical protein
MMARIPSRTCRRSRVVRGVVLAWWSTPFIDKVDLRARSATIATTVRRVSGSGTRRGVGACKIVGRTTGFTAGRREARRKRRWRWRRLVRNLVLALARAVRVASIRVRPRTRNGSLWLVGRLGVSL